MPQLSPSLMGSRPTQSLLATWFDRGYEYRSGDVVCMLCGASVAPGLQRPGDAKPYWQVHDEWHQALDGR